MIQCYIPHNSGNPWKHILWARVIEVPEKKHAQPTGPTPEAAKVTITTVYNYFLLKWFIDHRKLWRLFFGKPHLFHPFVLHHPKAACNFYYTLLLVPVTTTSLSHHDDIPFILQSYPKQVQDLPYFEGFELVVVHSACSDVKVRAVGPAKMASTMMRKNGCHGVIDRAVTVSGIAEFCHSFMSCPKKTAWLPLLLKWV